MATIESSKLLFDKYRVRVEEYLLEDINESDTRSKLIDDLLINVLGWNEEDIKREKKGDSGKYDYQLSIPGFKFLIEAKKQFSNLKFPVSQNKTIVNFLYNSNKEVFDQIRGYCFDNNLQYGIITNGKQFIILKSINTDGSDWKKNSCLIFNGLDDIDKNYIDFYNNLSKNGVRENGGFSFLQEGETTHFQTIYSNLIDREKELIRNSLSANLTTLIESVFDDIYKNDAFNEDELIKECFVENNETKKNRDEIQKLFEDRAPRIGDVIPASNTRSIVNQIETDLDEEVSKVNYQPPNPIIIIGSKGAGKTTFIKHLFKSQQSSFIKDNHLVIYIDIRNVDKNDLSKIDDIISKRIIEQIHTKYSSLKLHTLNNLKRMYSREIKRKDEGEWNYFKEHDLKEYQKFISDYLTNAQNDYFFHLKRINEHLIRDRRKRLIVIFDNADQYDEIVQETIFLFSHRMSADAYSGVMVSLREGYFYRWRNSPPFDAYISNVYHISAPKYSEILLKRINFAIKSIDVSGTTSGKTRKGFKTKVQNQDVLLFLRGLKKSIFRDDNSELIDYLSFTTYPNIREGLRVFNRFLISGHTQVDEYVLREKFKQSTERDFQIIPIHEFIKSIGLHNKLYYNSQNSIIHNLFYPSYSSENHFLKYFLLKDLLILHELNGVVGNEKSCSEIINQFIDFGFNLKEINSSIFDLFKFGLIDSNNTLSDTEISDLDTFTQLNLQSIRITGKGYYYIKSLIGTLVYLDLILQDTPIYNQEYFNRISGVFPKSDLDGKRSLKKRVEATQEFIRYLRYSETLLGHQVLNKYGSPMDFIEGLLSPYLNKISNSLNS